jgi:hypothetical protein
MIDEMKEDDERRAGLIDFGRILALAEVRARGASDCVFRGEGKVHFALIWDAVTRGIGKLSPAAELMIVDDCRADELPERWPRGGGERMRKRVEAKWGDAADRLAIPAWDMEATFSEGSGIADTYSRLEIPMYLGANGVLYVGAGEQTPAGTRAGGSTFHTPDSLPEVWHEQWQARGTIDNRHEAAAGFANLVVKHSLMIDL